MAHRNPPDSGTASLVESYPHRPGRTTLDAIAAIPEEHVWLASRKSPRTGRAYRQDVEHFMRTIGIRLVNELRGMDPRAVLAWEAYMREVELAEASTVRRCRASVSATQHSLALGQDGSLCLTDWSFSQLRKLADVSKDTLNKLSADAAGRGLGETLPQGTKPLHALATGETVRAIHGASYTWVYNADLLTMVREFATDFVPPQAAGIDGNQLSVTDDDIPFVPDPEPTLATGLSCVEQHMFFFLIDPRSRARVHRRK